MPGHERRRKSLSTRLNSYRTYQIFYASRTTIKIFKRWYCFVLNPSCKSKRWALIKIWLNIWHYQQSGVRDIACKECLQICEHPINVFTIIGRTKFSHRKNPLHRLIQKFWNGFRRVLPHSESCILVRLCISVSCFVFEDSRSMACNFRFYRQATLLCILKILIRGHPLNSWLHNYRHRQNFISEN